MEAVKKAGKSRHPLSSETGSAGRSPSRPERGWFERELSFFFFFFKKTLSSVFFVFFLKSILPVGCCPAAGPPESAPARGTSASPWALPASRPA